jgi:type VI secretion system (T6SS) phospholipase Tle1-like effector
MTRFVSRFVLPLELPDSILHENVVRACHALSLDDERTTFHPVLWTEKGEKPAKQMEDGSRYLCGERISQVWFPGVHSNVGGGYPDDSLAHVPLVWMMKEAARCGLKFKELDEYEPDALRCARSAANTDGRLYNPRSGIGAYYRYGPRNVFELCNSVRFGRPKETVEIPTPKIHHTVFERISDGVRPYAPIGVPGIYAVIDEDGKIVEGNNRYESVTQAEARAKQQEKVWDFVSMRRLAYFGTIGASLYLFLAPFFVTSVASEEFRNPLTWVRDFIRFIGAFLPAFSEFWIDFYARKPHLILLGALSLGFFAWLGAKLGGKITDEMLRVWKLSLHDNLQPNYVDDTIEYKFRTNKVVRFVNKTLLNYLIPGVATFIGIYLIFAVASRVVFNIADAAGIYCRESPHLAILRPGEEWTIRFTPDSLCGGTMVALIEGESYSITISQIGRWQDGSQETTLRGFSLSDIHNWYQRVLFALALPLRRVLFHRWSRVIARVGAVGSYEEFIDPDPVPAPQSVASARFRLGRSGELFLYVNEAVLPIPGFERLFYKNNEGVAGVRVRRR